MIQTEAIDVEEYLQSKHIDYDPPGSKNVGRNSVGIQCPFCGDHNYSGANHLGIKLDTKQWNCWICGQGRNRSFLYLVKRLENCSYRQAEEILKPFLHRDMSLLPTGADLPLIQNERQFSLPAEAENRLLSMHKLYLQSRNFDAEYIFNKYQLKCVGPISKKWKFRLIAPIIFNRRTVSFLGADVTRKHNMKYKNCPINESIIPINQTLYNYDNSNKHTVIVCEGVTDVWRIDDGTVAIYRKFVTSQQMKILSTFNRVFIMLDSDALEAAEQLANNLAGFVETEIIELDDGDPADLSESDIKHLRHEVFGQ